MNYDALIQNFQTAGIEGRFTKNGDLGKLSWFRCGGQADVIFSPKDEADLVEFLRLVPTDIPVYVFGIGSNILVRDGGVRGIVIRLSQKGFGRVERDGTNQLVAGCAASDKSVASAALEFELGGFHFFHGIPGGVGGALRMNAGANGIETAERVVKVRALDRQGKIHILDNKEMNFSYRSSGVPHDFIFVSAILSGPSSTPDAIRQAMSEVQQHRESVQPVREKTGGSTFRNPPGWRAWEVIDAAGCRGMEIGGAQMSIMHCNFMINKGNACANDLECLGETVRARVLSRCGIDLHWEIQRIGEQVKAQAC